MLAELVEKIKNEGKREGKREGIRDGKRETAKKMLLKGFNVQEIAELTGLTKKEIVSIK